MKTQFDINDPFCDPDTFRETHAAPSSCTVESIVGFPCQTERDKMRDYGRIHYYQDDMGRIWHGPFCQEDNVHYKTVDEVGVGHSDLPPFCVEITPWQAAQELRRKNVRPAL